MTVFLFYGTRKATESVGVQTWPKLISFRTRPYFSPHHPVISMVGPDLDMTQGQIAFCVARFLDCERTSLDTQDNGVSLISYHNVVSRG